MARLLLIVIIGSATIFIAYLVGAGEGYRAAEKDHGEHIKALYDREHAEVAATP